MNSHEIKNKLEQPATKEQLKKTLQVSTKQEEQTLVNQLQALRKAGEITLLGDSWALNTFSLCPHCEGKGWVETK